MANLSIQNYLAGFTVELALPTVAKVIGIASDTKPVVAFNTLIENGILSAPVVDLATSQVVGVLDIRDALNYIIHSDDNKTNNTSILDQQHLSAYYKLRPYRAVTLTTNLADVVELLGEYHRLAVVDGNGKIVNIISQSSIVSFLQKHADDEPLQAVMNTVLDDVKKLGTHPVKTIRDNSSIYEALVCLKQNNINGMGIVDQTGALIANTSCSDIKAALAQVSHGQGGRLLDFPVLEFQNEVRRRKNPFKTSAAVVATTSTSTIATVIGKLAVCKMHRIFIVDNHYKPQRVVAVSDICKYLSSLP